MFFSPVFITLNILTVSLFTQIIMTLFFVFNVWTLGVDCDHLFWSLKGGKSIIKEIHATHAKHSKCPGGIQPYKLYLLFDVCFSSPNPFFQTNNP